MMERKPVKWIAILGMACSLALPILLASCDQEALFYKIAQEVEPKEPRIKGAPTNFVEFGGAVYVASDNLYRYTGSWSTPGKPDGKIKALAATGTYLYALTGSGLYRSTNGANWNKVTIPSVDGYPSLQTIYGAGNTLFGSLWSRADNPNQSNTCAIFYITDGGTSGEVTRGTALLSGAVKSNGHYYLSNGATWKDSEGTVITQGGTYDIGTGTPWTFPSPIGGGNQIMGLIDVGGDIIGVARNGNILKIEPANSNQLTAYSTDQLMTGAIALWGDGSGGKLLLLGIQPAIVSDDVSTYGYREIVLSGGNLTGAALQKPGTGDPSSVHNGDADKYDVTIGPRPVNHLFQAPDGILFAAIQGTGASTDGLEGGVWSYRNNEWNAEE